MFCYNDPIYELMKAWALRCRIRRCSKEEFDFSNITAGGSDKDSIGLTLAAADSKAMRAALGMGAVFLVYIL